MNGRTPASFALMLLLTRAAPTRADELPPADASAPTPTAMCRKVIFSPCLPGQAAAAVAARQGVVERTGDSSTRGARRAGPSIARTKSVVAAASSQAPPRVPEAAPAAAGVSSATPDRAEGTSWPVPQLDFSRLHWSLTRKNYGVTAPVPYGRVEPPDVRPAGFGVVVERRFGF